MHEYNYKQLKINHNDNPDQFMNIYDDILPKDIRPDEVT